MAAYFSQISRKSGTRRRQVFTSPIVPTRMLTSTPIKLQRRPLIFICHSYGGVLLSHCLVRANAIEDERRRSLYKSTYGMLFFGTPHRGSPKDDVLKMVEQAHPNRVPALMQTAPGSGELKLQLQLFADLVRDRQVGSFYETEPTPVPTQVGGAHISYVYGATG